MDREVQEERARQFADHHGLQYVEVSAAENINVEVCFEQLVDRIIEKHGAKVRVQGKGQVQVTEESAKPSSCCVTSLLKEQT